MRRLMSQRHKVRRHANLIRDLQHAAGLQRSLSIPANITEPGYETRKRGAVDCSHAEAGISGDLVVEECVCQECGGFDGMGQVSAHFPGHDLVYGVASGAVGRVFWVCAVDFASDSQEIFLVPPGRYGVFCHGCDGASRISNSNSGSN